MAQTSFVDSGIIYSLNQIFNFTPDNIDTFISELYSQIKDYDKKKVVGFLIHLRKEIISAMKDTGVPCIQRLADKKWNTDGIIADLVSKKHSLTEYISDGTKFKNEGIYIEHAKLSKYVYEEISKLAGYVVCYYIIEKKMISMTF
jgi:hypothetical protein